MSCFSTLLNSDVNMFLFLFFNFANLLDVQLYLIEVLLCISLVTHEIKYIFICWLATLSFL